MRRDGRAGRTIKAFTAMLAVTSMAVAVALGAAGQATAQPGASITCKEYMVYLIPGTTETNEQANPNKPVGLLKDVGDVVERELGSDSVGVVYVPYSASAFSKGLSYKASQATGVRNAAKLMAMCPNSKTALGGYSQGADAAGDVAWHIGNANKPIKADMVKAVGLLADPKSGHQAVVGVSKTGEGISGSRPGGYGSLQSRIKWVCADKDMYCNTKSKNPMAKVIGHAIGSGGPQEGVTPLDGSVGDDSMGSMASNLGNADLVGAKSKATDLKTRTEALSKTDKPTADQLNTVADLASSLNTTYSATKDAADFANTSGARETLTASGEGTPENKAASFLNTVDKTDMNSLTSETSDIASTAKGLVSSLGQSGALTNGGEALQQLALKGANVALASDALNSTDRSNLSAATSVLSVLQVSSVVDTALTATTVLLSTDYQGIYDDIAAMVDLAAKQDAPGVFDKSTDLLDKIEPWVDLASSANSKLMPMASQMVGMIPDPQGIALGVSIGMKLFSQVDIKAIWNVARQAHQIAGQVIKGKPEAAVGLIPVGLNLATIGISALTGSDSGLGGSSTATGGTNGGTNGGANGTNSLVDSGESLTKVATQLGASPNGSEDVSQLVTDGLDFASFLNSGAHTSSYTNKKLVQGYSSVEYLGMYFATQLKGSGGSDSSSSRGSDSSSSSEDSEESSSPSSPSEPSPSNDRDGSGDQPRESMFGG